MPGRLAGSCSKCAAEIRPCAAKAHAHSRTIQPQSKVSSSPPPLLPPSTHSKCGPHAPPPPPSPQKTPLAHACDSSPGRLQLLLVLCMPVPLHHQLHRQALCVLVHRNQLLAQVLQRGPEKHTREACAPACIRAHGTSIACLPVSQWGSPARQGLPCRLPPVCRRWPSPGAASLRAAGRQVMAIAAMPSTGHSRLGVKSHLAVRRAAPA